MATTPPDVPIRFPCWVRAIYSWGGETKKDLGFVEGDLIECLNAGQDGWWMGRLRRDRRAMGLFPSNFVTVLDESFVPVSRTTSSNPGAAPPAADVGPRKKAIRKPFQAYSLPTEPKPSSPTKLPSYLQPTPEELFRQNAHKYRAPSPGYQASPQPSRSGSPMPLDLGSSPPPPPPPHRVAYNAARSRASRPTSPLHQRPSHTPVAQSPNPGHTPSPLRDAMDDVMSSLQDMALRAQDETPSREATPPLDPWSPEAFEEVRSNSRKRRPRSSLGFSTAHQDNYMDEESLHDFAHHPRSQYDAPRLDDFVDRMENDLDRDQRDFGIPSDILSANVGSERPASSMERIGDRVSQLRHRKSAYELGKQMVSRTFTTKSTVTNVSNSTQSSDNSASTQATNQSLMSGYSAGAFSATSAGSLARKRGTWGSIRGRPTSVAGTRLERPRAASPLTGVSYHSSHASGTPSAGSNEWAGSVVDSGTSLGGLTRPPQLKQRKSGFLRKLVESAKTGTASVRSSIAGAQEVPRSPVKSLLPHGITAIAGGTAAKDRQPSANVGTTEWIHVRRDVNRANSLSEAERAERADRCQMTAHPVIAPVAALAEGAEGDEGLDGMPVSEPTDFQATNLQLVDKSARFITSLPAMINPASLAQAYVCRPYRNDVQRFRAIFTWISEKVVWEEDFEGEPDPRRVIHTRRGSAEEVAVLVFEMCRAMGLGVEVVHGYLKTPDEMPDLTRLPRPNHFWNAVLINGEWRLMDCSLASPSHPKRHQFSSISAQTAEPYYFLTRPMELCYTHVPVLLEQQHIVPPVAPEILQALPCCAPPFFRNGLQMIDYDTSLFHLEGLEIMQIHIETPADVELVAEVTATTYDHDADGDRFETGDLVVKRALAQPEWIAGRKRFTIKALLPDESSQGTLRVYAGKRGLLHSIASNPHPLALSIPILHHGANPPYDFFTRHPTPHAQRHDLYVAQPQCKILACSNTFVFAVRQHPSASPAASFSSDGGSVGGSSGGSNSGGAGGSTFLSTARGPSPLPFARPPSAMSMTSSSASGSGSGSTSTTGNLPSHAASQAYKPAKLALQAPSGKIHRLARRSGEADVEGGTWEAFIKVGEQGTWRGLVLADRSARWCVFGEWECV